MPSRRIIGQLFDLAAPIIGLNVLNVLSLAVDTAMVGRLPHAEVELTALGFATQLIFLLLVAMMGLTVGTVALISRAHGGGDSQRVNHVMVQSTQLTAIIGVVVGILGVVLAEWLLRGLGASGAAVSAGVDYLRPLFAGTIFYYLTILYGGVLRGVGNTRLPFLVALVANLVNFVLNYLLILGNAGFPQLGVRGAAIGTVASQAVGAAILMYILSRGSVAGLRLPLRLARIDARLARQLFRVGWPAALDMLILNAGFLTIIGLLGRIDQVAVAAHGIGLRIQGLAFVPGLSVSQATGAMVGNALGAGDRERARQVVRASVLLCAVIMTSLAIAIIVAAHPIVGIFDVAAGSELERYSVMWMRLLGYAMPIVGVHIAFIGMMQGSGATGTSLSINAASTLLVQIPLGALLGFTLDLGAFGVWLSFPIAFVLKVILSTIVYKRGRWATVGVGARASSHGF